MPGHFSITSGTTAAVSVFMVYAFFGIILGMKIDELVVCLYDVLKSVMGSRTIEELYRSVFGDASSVEEVSDNLVRANLATKERLDALVSDWTGDPDLRSLSNSDRLLLTCRAEGAIAVLTLLLQAQSESQGVRLVIDSDTGCELPWALRDLWQPFSLYHLADAARNFCAGKWSILG